MQTVLEVNRLKPLGTKVLVKRAPVKTHFGRIEIPQMHRDRNDLNGMLFDGIAIAVGEKTKSARFGHGSGYFEPGDKIYFWHPWDWHDREVVLKDKETGEEYLTIDEKDVQAYEQTEEAA